MVAMVRQVLLAGLLPAVAACITTPMRWEKPGGHAAMERSQHVDQPARQGDRQGADHERADATTGLVVPRHPRHQREHRNEPGKAEKKLRHHQRDRLGLR